MTAHTLADTMARKTDPEQSHAAAASVAVRLPRLKLAVLDLFVKRRRPLTGSKGNELYQQWRPAYDWPTAAPDSPRKRMGELHAQGFLRVRRKVKGPNGTDEAEYELTDYAHEYLASLQKD